MHCMHTNLEDPLIHHDSTTAEGWTNHSNHPSLKQETVKHGSWGAPSNGLKWNEMKNKVFPRIPTRKYVYDWER